MCFETAASETSNGSASSVTVDGPLLERVQEVTSNGV